MKDGDNAMGFERSPSASGPEALPPSQFNSADTWLYACAHTRDPMERASDVAICLCASLSGRVWLNMHWGKLKQLC